MKRSKKKSRIDSKDASNDYGPNAAETDISEEEMTVKKQRILNALQADNIHEIQLATVGQHDNARWFEVRRNRLTASLFGRICQRRDATPCHSFVKNLLYSSHHLTTPGILYGRLHEKTAIEKYQELKNVKVSPSGFFISEELPYLGASPDGLVAENGLVEVKCLYSVRDKNIREAVIEKCKNGKQETGKQTITVSCLQIFSKRG